MIKELWEKKLFLMRKQWKNIPFTKQEIDSLPLGFTETAFKHTREKQKGSKYIPTSPYNTNYGKTTNLHKGANALNEKRTSIGPRANSQVLESSVGSKAFHAAGRRGE